ncbi:DEAD/DEAH box helicase [Acutalibacter sp. 1XD8-33]|uniref:SNF2-related protein n=1 Tax=Acutalibacter sp. 1XD8-33 TaxID=2320081 RepID=UPI000EA0B62B|nr:DEAD/DEAH box helicase [Acutalibacter sp. 1XD8-33]RKJ41943.1 DEAD/DEAH box helicase [Acutalibacter sp. 1XD8-33]
MRYIPHDYQAYCIDFLLEHPAAGLFLKPGMGKTSIALTAADHILYDSFEVSKVLVIAPLRVAEDTWSRESAKWDHLKHLRVSKVLGDAKKRLAALEADADLYCINRENVSWLVKHYGPHWPFDLVIIDELSNFRNPTSKRFRALRKVRPLIKHIWGLTGTPRPRSLLDLWAQVYLLDRGKRLGETYGGYKDRYFTPGRRNGYVVFDWDPRPGAEEEITERISDICVSLETDGNLEMPELVVTNRPVILSHASKAQYEQLEREAVLPLADCTIDAASAAAVNGKLLQLAGGAVYDDDHRAREIHCEKLDALEDIIAEANGEPVLVAYRFQHERDRILARFPQAVQMKDSSTIAAWNRGEIPILLAHPAGAGHGLNLQDGGHIIVWFGPTYDLELDEQFNDRLYRQGQRSTTSIIYLVAEGTVEEEAMQSLKIKADEQASMMEALKARIEKYTA